MTGRRTVSRGENAAGIIFYDNTGQERGGNVTFDEGGNVVLTLDSRHSQVALFVADTAGATTLRMRNGEDEINLRAGASGARVTGVRDGDVVFQAPVIENPESTSTCAGLRELRSRLDEERIRGICRARMPVNACDRCLGTP